MKRLILTIVLVALIATPALANITIGPGDGANYTRQEWTFTTNPGIGPPWDDIQADIGYINNTPPEADVDTEGSPSGYWIDTLPDFRQGGIWGEAVNLDLFIGNTVNSNLTKIVQVEVDYHVCPDSIGGYVANYSVLHGMSANDLYYPVSAVVTGNPGEWQEVTIEWQIPQDYSQEIICLRFVDSGVTIDKVDAATVCIPEPATIGLLGLGALSLLRRKRSV